MQTTQSPHQTWSAVKACTTWKDLLLCIKPTLVVSMGLFYLKEGEIDDKHPDTSQILHLNMTTVTARITSPITLSAVFLSIFLIT